jgi:rhodanese-related sulfurtransferase
MIEAISPSALKDHLGSFRVIDVRTPAEFEGMHIEGSISRPLDALKPSEISTMESQRGCVFVCFSGSRARQAAQQCKANNKPIFILDGGIQAWESAGLSLIRGRKTISLERQVRITAGGLVLLGAILAYFVHGNWILLSGFVGAGLIFAGITDTCGMGMLLARMPWNQRKSRSACCTSK